MVNKGQFKELTCNNYASLKKLYRSMLAGSELTTAQSVQLKTKKIEINLSYFIQISNSFAVSPVSILKHVKEKNE